MVITSCNSCGQKTNMLDSRLLWNSTVGEHLNICRECYHSREYAGAYDLAIKIMTVGHGKIVVNCPNCKFAYGIVLEELFFEDYCCACTRCGINFYLSITEECRLEYEKAKLKVNQQKDKDSYGEEFKVML